MGQTETANTKTVREFTRIFKNEHDVDGVDHLFDGTFQHHFRMPLPPGLQGFKAIGRVINAAFPDVRVTETDLITAGDRVVERSDVVGTHLGDFMVVPPTRRTVKWSEIRLPEACHVRRRDHRNRHRSAA
jgi:predicted ester cyclase